VEQGDVRAVDPFRIALFVAQGIKAVILRRPSEEPPTAVESEVEWMVRTLVDGISTKGRAS
jgi:hypothetical protein